MSLKLQRFIGAATGHQHTWKGRYLRPPASCTLERIKHESQMAQLFPTIILFAPKHDSRPKLPLSFSIAKWILNLAWINLKEGNVLLKLKKPSVDKSWPFTPVSSRGHGFHCLLLGFLPLPTSKPVLEWVILHPEICSRVVALTERWLPDPTPWQLRATVIKRWPCYCALRTLAGNWTRNLEQRGQVCICNYWK